MYKLILILLFNSVTFISIAAVRTWTGNGADNNMSTPANWEGGIAPNANDDIVFAGTTRLTPNNNQSISYYSLSFSPGSGDFVISGNPITITAGESAFKSFVTSGTITIKSNLNFGSVFTPYITTAEGGSLVLDGDIYNNGDTINIIGAGNTTINGIISGSGGLVIQTKAPSVTIVLGENTFTGNVYVKDGELRITNNKALGAGTKLITVKKAGASEPCLRLDGSYGAISLPSTLSFETSACSGSTGGIISEAGANSIHGNFKLIGGDKDTRFLVNTGSLALTGEISLSLNNRGVIFDGPGNGVFSGKLTNGGFSPGATLVKNGSGTWIVSGANTFSGLATINAGILKLGNSKALGSATGATIVNSGAVLDLNGITYTNAESLTLNGTGISGSGVLINSNTSAASFPGTITLASASLITADNQITLSGNITNNQHLTKAGANSLIFASNTISVNDFSILSGTLDGGNSNILISGSFTSNGTFIPSNNNVNMVGTTSQILPDVLYKNLTINNSAGVSLATSINVTGVLTLSSGLLTTGINHIDLGTTGSIIETSPNGLAPTSYVTGTVLVRRTLTSTGGAQAFGGIGVTLSESNIASNITDITRVTGTACYGEGQASILRYFTISPATSVGLNASMDFKYFDHEIISHAEGVLDLYKSTDSRLSWNRLSPIRNEAANTLSLTGITSFSDWTASDGVNASLPIELISFKAVASDYFVELRWATASEIDNNYFTIEQSADGQQWFEIKSIPGAGNSTIYREYKYRVNETIEGIVYYRLVQTDYNGSFSYSKIISVPGINTNDATIEISFNKLIDLGT